MYGVSEYEALRHVPITDGDLVRVRADLEDLYSVILVREGRVWLRNLRTEMDTLASVAECRRVGHEGV